MSTTVLQEDFESISEWATTGVFSVRTGRTGVSEQVGAGAGTLTYTIPGVSESDTVTIGFAWKISSISSNRTVASLRSDAAATQHLTIVATSTGAIEIRRGTVSGTVLATTATGLIAINTWNYLELQAKLHDTTGFVTLRLNGTQVATATNVDTKNAGTKTTFDSVQLAGATGIADTFDDLYLITGADGTFQGVQRYGSTVSVLHEPFDNLSAWTIPAGSPTITGAGRTGNAVNLVLSGNQIQYTIPSGQRSYFAVVGLALKIPTLPISALSLVSFLTGGGVTGVGNLQINTNGSITGAPNGTSSAAGLIVAGTWIYLEIMGLFHNTAGAWWVRANNTLLTTNIDTNLATPPISIDTIRVNGISDGQLVDDLYIRTGTLSDFEGDQAIGATTPTAKVWNGSAFVDAPIKTWNGSAFVDAAAVKTWNGSAFV